jgi:2-polyprenyl-3-methyl-5-hydroxy-6-metoxy-1,4-benzoquinol methylase
MNQERILEENIRVHDAESQEYSFLHPEQYNFYQLRVLKKQVALISKLVTGETREFLDLGCGEGYLTIPFLKSGFTCTCVDASSGMLQILETKIPDIYKGKFKLVNKDIPGFLRTTRKNFDVIGICGVLHHLPNFTDIIDFISKRLKKSGFLFITHEPLKQRVELSFRLNMHNLLRSIDESIYNFLRKPERYSKKYNYEIADYQRQFGGIAPDSVVTELEARGIVTLLVSKFCVRRSGTLAFIANNFIGSENTFSILACKI